VQHVSLRQRDTPVSNARNDMTAQDAQTWFEIPERGLARAQRFYEALLDIASSGEARRPLAAGARRRIDADVARPGAPAPAHGPEA